MFHKGYSITQEPLDGFLVEDVSAMPRVMRNPPRIDTQGHCPSSSSSFSSVHPSTPSPNFFYRRHSVASTSSWEPGLSGHSSAISPHSVGPSTPKREEELSTVDLFAPENFNYSNPTVIHNHMMEHDFSEVMGSQPGFQDVAPVVVPKGILDFDYSDYELPSFGHMSNPYIQEVPRYQASSTPYDPSLLRFDLAQPSPEFSSPIGSTYTPSTNERHSRTVIPSQTCADASIQTPLPNPEYQPFYDRVVISESPDSMNGYSLTSSPCHTPSRQSSTRSVRNGRPSINSVTAAGIYHLASPMRVTKSSKKNNKTRTCNIRGIEATVVGTNKVHKCRWVKPDGSVCDKAFQRQEHLKRHEKTHDGKKPFKCLVPGCVKDFSRSDNLKSHNKTHDPSKPGGRNLKVPNFESYLQT